jgi:hypothetical protein
MLKLHIKPRPVFAILGIVLLVLAVVACFLPNRTVSGRVQEPSGILPAMLVFLAAYAFLYVPWNVRRLYLQNATKDHPLAIEATDEGITFRSSRGQASLPWSDFRHWRGNDKVVLLYETDASFFGVPAHFFANPETYVAFQGLVGRHLRKAG